MKRRGFQWMIVGFILMALCGPLWGAEFPSKPITYLVPWSAGGSDACARILANAASQHLGQPVVVENKPGASGTLAAATMAATSKPDGYTISELPLTIFRLPHIMETNYDPLKDFTYIIHLTGYVFGVIVKADSPFKTFQDFLDYARANPGQATYASTGGSSVAYTTMEMLGRNLGINWVNVPQKGSGEVCSAVLGGHVTVGVTTSGWAPLVASGDMRLLATFGDERSKKFPDVPTVRELGYGIVTKSPYGLVGPKGMDPKVVQTLHDAFKKALETPEYQQILNQYDMTSEYKSSADYEKLAKDLWEEEKLIVQQLNLKEKQ